MSKYELLQIKEKTTIKIPDVNFSRYSDIENKMSELESTMVDITNKIKQIAISTPITITPSGYTPIEYVNAYISDLIDEYRDASQLWDWLLLAQNIINNYAKTNSIDKEAAFSELYIDKYADIKKEMKK